jgi:RNA polymerase sigma-70 factor (ECF subfamily)
MDKFSTFTDDQLVNLYKSGTDAAFDALLTRHKDRLYSYIYYTVHEAELADDIFQETFVKVIMNIRQGRYVCNGRFDGWLLRIAHNLIIDHYRSVGSSNALSSEEISLQLYDGGCYHDGGDEREKEAAESLRQLRELIDLLPDNQQEVLRLRLYDEVSFKDIAALKGISINTALGRMHYAILNMRRLAAERHLTVYNF